MESYLRLLDTEIEEHRYALLFAWKRGDHTEARRIMWKLQGVRQARNLATVYMAVRASRAA